MSSGKGNRATINTQKADPHINHSNSYLDNFEGHYFLHATFAKLDTILRQILFEDELFKAL